MTTTELASPRVTTVTGIDAPIVAQNSAVPVAAAAIAAPEAVAAPASLGTLSGATAGTQIIRGDARIPVDGSANLMAGDRVLVPQGGSANVTFPGPTPNKAPMNGVLSGGADALIGVKQLTPGVEQVVVDLAAGDLFMALPDELADAASVAVRKKAAASAGSIFDSLGLAALGLGGLAALSSGGGSSDSGINSGTSVATMMPPPGSGTGGSGTDPNNGGGGGGGGNNGGGTTPPVGTGLLAPAATAVGNTTAALGGGVLAGSGLPMATKPVVDAVTQVTNAVNEALTPLVGDSFTPNSPNNFDPVDSAVGTATDALTPVATPLVDGLLGAGAAESIVAPVATQVDFVTDALSTIVNSAGLAPVANGLYLAEGPLAQVNGVVNTVTGSLLGSLGDVFAPITGLLGGAGGGGTPGLPAVPGLPSLPGLPALPDLLGGLTGGGGAPGLPAIPGLPDLLGGITGGGAVDAGGLLGGALTPVTGLLGELTGALGDVDGGGTINTPLGSLDLGLGSNAGSLGGGLLGNAIGIAGDLLGNVPVFDMPGTDSILDTATGMLGGLPSGGGGVPSLPGLPGLPSGGGLPALDPATLPGTDLLSGLLDALGHSASTGEFSLGTNNLPLSADGILAALNGADPTGGLLGGQLGGLLGDAPSPSAEVHYDASGLLADLSGLQGSGESMLGQIPGISSVSDPAASGLGGSPLGSLLSNLPQI
ncbi:MAG: hypothetical protein V4562_07285 [Pseudomonadota bacterium]